MYCFGFSGLVSIPLVRIWFPGSARVAFCELRGFPAGDLLLTKLHGQLAWAKPPKAPAPGARRETREGGLTREHQGARGDFLVNELQFKSKE